MVPTSAAEGPIPPARKDDSEDVAWALSTAEAMYARGDRGDALKWLRRAAEAASEALADDRALELAKAAADLASTLAPTTSVRPPPLVTSAPPPPVISAPPAPRTSAPPVPPAPPSRPAPPPPPPSRPAPPAATPSSPPTARAPEVKPAPARSAAPSPLRISEPRRVARPEITLARPADEVTQQVPAAAAQAAARAGAVPPPPPTPRALPTSGDPDAWPTQSLAADDLSDPPDEKTRIGVPAYQVSALAPEPASPAPRTLDPTLKPSQAVRVVVWRAADGVHVAPQGTRVSAISVDAILVALDPSADLAAWLSGK